MSDLDRMKKLAGLKETGGYVDYDRFKDRGKGKIDLKKYLPSQQVPDYMKKGINYVDTRDLKDRGPYRTFPPKPEMDPSLGAGFDPETGFAKADPNADPSLGAGFDPETGFAKGPDKPDLYMKRPMRSEAVGDSAECFYDLQDEYCGEQCPSMPHKILIDELVRYLSGDQLQDFCDDFRRHHMDGMEESKDLNELRKLAGMGTGTDVPLGGFPKTPKVPDMGTGTDIMPFDPDEADAMIKRGKENQIIGKYRPPGSPRDPELDDILRRRAKELEDDPRIGRGIELPMPDDGRLEIPGYNRDKIRDLIRDLPLTPGPQKDDEFKQRINRIRKMAR